MSGRSKLSLGRKREREPYPEDIHDTSDDFQEVTTVFRLPKKLKTKKYPSKSKKSEPDKNVQDKNVQEKNVPERSASSSAKEPPKDDSDLQEIEKMLCDESEKLCPSCKQIVPSMMYFDHFQDCLQRFKLSRRGSEKKPSEAKADLEGNGQEEAQLLPLPCPVCKKSFKSKVQRVSHIKACAQGHGIPSEQLLMASRLLEKQAEEWNDLGLPSVLLPQTSRANTRRTVKRAKDHVKDPDMAMALALSRSMAEEEVESRISREERLLALGMENIVDEDRKVKPVLLPPPDSVTLRKGAKERKGLHQLQRTALARRSVEERERLISERVAVILTSGDTTRAGWDNEGTKEHPTRLAGLVNKPSTLWEAARRGGDEPLEAFYVPELQPYINPKETVVGSLLRHLSQVPGRLNTTVAHALDEESESESETEQQTSDIEEFCTQMALAELMGSQDEWEATPEVTQAAEGRDNQGFLTPAPITNTHTESEPNTSILKMHSEAQAGELNEGVDTEAAFKENDEGEIQGSKDNIEELEQISDLKNKSGTSRLLNTMEKVKNTSVTPPRKENKLVRNTDLCDVDEECDDDTTSLLYNTIEKVENTSVTPPRKENNLVRNTDLCDTDEECDNGPTSLLHNTKNNENTSTKPPRKEKNLVRNTGLLDTDEECNYGRESSGRRYETVSSSPENDRADGSPEIPRRQSTRTRHTSQQSASPEIPRLQRTRTRHTSQQSASPEIPRLQRTRTRHTSQQSASPEIPKLQRTRTRHTSQQSASPEIPRLQRIRTRHTSQQSAVISECGGREHNTTSVPFMQITSPPCHVKTNSKKSHTENVCHDSQTDSKGQSQIHAEIIEVCNLAGCTNPSTCHSASSTCSADSGACFSSDTLEGQAGGSPVRASQQDQDMFTPPIRTCDDLKNKSGIAKTISPLHNTKETDENALATPPRKENKTHNTHLRDTDEECDECEETDMEVSYVGSFESHRNNIVHRPDENDTRNYLVTSKPHEDKTVTGSTLKDGACSGNSASHVENRNHIVQRPDKKDTRNYLVTSKPHEDKTVTGSTLKPGKCSGNSASHVEKDSMSHTLIDNWRDILQSGTGSDVIFETSDGSRLSAHSLVLLARCPKLYRESKTQGNVIRWDDVPQKTAHHFLSYLYCGTCEVSNPSDPQWMELYDVALRYHCRDLVSCMELLYKDSSTLVKTPDRHLRRDLDVMNSVVNLDSPSPLSKKVVKCAVPSVKIPVENIEEDLLELKSPSDSVSDLQNKFVTDYGKVLKPTRLFSTEAEGESGDTNSPEQPQNSPENEPSKADVFSNKRQNTSEHLQRNNGSESPDFFDESLCFGSCTTPPLNLPPLTVIPQHSNHRKITHSVPKAQAETSHTPPQTSSLSKLSTSLKEDQKINTNTPNLNLSNTSENSIGGHEHNISSARSSSPLTPLPVVEPIDHNDDSNSVDVIEVRQSSDSETSVADYRGVSDGPTENCDDENEEPVVCETSDTHDNYISDIWDDFDAANSPITLPEESYYSYINRSMPNVCEKISNDDLSNANLTPALPQSSIHHVAASTSTSPNAPDSHERDIICSGVVLSSQAKKKERLNFENRHTVPADDSLGFTARHVGDDTLVNIAAEIEQWDSDLRPAGTSTHLVTPGKASCSTPATRETSGKAKSMIVTPMPDYKIMKSPDLKKALQKYGICALARNKAVMVLQHVYEQTHPLVTDSEAESSFSHTPQRRPVKPVDEPKLPQPQIAKRRRYGLASEEKIINKNIPARKVPGKKCRGGVKEGEEEEEESDEGLLNCSLSSTSSEDSNGALFGDIALPPEEEDNLSSTQQVDLASKVREMITSMDEVHRKVLVYEPIFVEELHASLKASKVKCSMHALMDVLDNLCIIVRTQASQNRNQARATKKRKTSPKRKKS